MDTVHETREKLLSLHEFWLQAEETHCTVPVRGRVHTSAAVRASILYRKWLLRQRSNVSCEALRLSAPPSLSPPL